MILALILWLGSWSALGASQAAAPVVAVPKPGPATTCPVCGMFVAKYPNWVATVVWRNGQAVHFDGAKDLFTYVLDLAKYAPGRSAKDLQTIAVTEFYDLRAIDARQAYFVVGSDVLGPMGREFIPLATRADAEEFLADHHGTGILRFTDVTPQVLRDVDEGRVDRRETRQHILMWPQKPHGSSRHRRSQGPARAVSVSSRARSSGALPRDGLTRWRRSLR